MIRKLIGAWLLLVAIPLHAQTVYRWVDGEGKVHFSATPPPGQQATEEQLRLRRGASEPVPAEEPGQPDERADYEKKKAEYDQAVAANEARIAAERARNCANARDIVARLIDQPARRYLQPDGTYIHYDDAQREERIAKARAAEAENCD